MRAFTYEQANSQVDAVAAMARTPGAKFNKLSLVRRVLAAGMQDARQGAIP